MSASKKKQQRKANAGSDELFSSKQSSKKEEKGSNVKYVIAGVVVAVVLVLSLVMLVYQGLVAPNAAAITVGGEKIYSHELNYYYINSYSNFINQVGTDYASQLFGLDTSKSLKTQTYYGDQSMTWHDYFLNMAENSAQQIHMLAAQAEAEGVTLNAENEGYVADEMESIKSYVEENGYNLDAYLSAMYGKRMTQSEYERLVRTGYLASQYSQSKTESFTDSYTDEDIAAYYNENKKDFDMVTYRRYLVSATLDDSMSETQRNQALDAAQDTADAMAAACTSEANFIAKVVEHKNATAQPTTDDEGNEVAPEEYTGDQAEADTLQSDVTYSSFGTATESNVAQADWLFDDARQLGDATTVDTTTGTYVLFFMSRTRNDYNTVDVRHILVSYDDYDADGNKIDPDAETTEDATETTDGTTTAQQDAAKAEAERILEEWESGEKTEASFGELAKQYTADSNGDEGGLYEQVYKGQMVTNFNEWIFGSGRKSGDTGVISTDYGYHVMYFVGDNDPYWMVQVRSAKTNADYSAWQTEKMEQFQLVEKSGISAVGLANQ